MIPAEAVEPALEAFLLESIKRKGELSERPCALLAALEAAAPYMHAEALREAIAAFPLETITAPDNAVAWLIRRAEQIEGEA